MGDHNVVGVVGSNVVRTAVDLEFFEAPDTDPGGAAPHSTHTTPPPEAEAALPPLFAEFKGSVEASVLQLPAVDGTVFVPARESLSLSRLLDRRAVSVIASLFVVAVPKEKLSLSKSARQVLVTENAGGSSALSEALSMELLNRMFGAELIKTEMAVRYTRQSSICDFVVSIAQHSFGVSVTRAVTHAAPLQQSDATALLSKKLRALAQAIDSVSDEDAWERGLLHVLVASSEDGDTVCAAFSALPKSLYRVAAVIVTVVKDAPWVFNNVSTQSKSKPKTKPKSKVNTKPKVQRQRKHR